jgi:hypothetical protein
MRNLACIAIALLGSTLATAQTIPSNVANLSWKAVTVYDDFAVIVDPVTYNVYAGVKGAAKSRVATGLTATAVTRSGVPVGVWCWHVTAVVNGVESIPSAEACKEIKVPAPPASTKPAQVTLLTIDAPDGAQAP